MSDVISKLYEVFLQCPDVSIDSRRISDGGLFFGLKGSSVDGSGFGPQALDQGARIAVVRHGSVSPREGLLFVDDPLTTLQELARFHRRQLQIPVLAITGSNGKTTTKELVSRVLSTQYRTKSTVGNLNNHIGVPLTLLSVTDTDEIAVVEMGANHIGEIGMLCNIAFPTHGLITNIGQAHLEGFGGIEGVKRGKSELYDALAVANGLAFVNADETFLLDLSRHVGRRLIYQCEDEPYTQDDHISFREEKIEEGMALSFHDKEQDIWTVRSSLFGSYNVHNIATAVTVGLHFGVSGSSTCEAIESYEPQNNRSQRLILGSNTVILDAYNANPTSMYEAILSFANSPGRNKLLILGSMMELGRYTEEAHLDIARQANAVANASVLFVGEAFRTPANAVNCPWYPDIEPLIEALLAAPPDQTQILIKGSRAMRLELLADALK
jgi:UDP-N-acetylmuramoyl-tripeptide--D-alanyl-D-alanine ligase